METEAILSLMARCRNRDYVDEDRLTKGGSQQARRSRREYYDHRAMGPDNSLEISAYLLCQQGALALTLACLISTIGGCNRALESSSEPPAHPVARVTAAEHKPVLPACPNAPSRMLQATDPGTGHHKVFLSWNASASASQSANNSLGYCLYRTQTNETAKKCPNQSDCEKVTPVPVLTTRCVDDLAKDRTKYHYVVIAIDSRGNYSSPGKEAIADIPVAGQQNPAPRDASSYPACRAPNALSKGLD